MFNGTSQLDDYYIGTESLNISKRMRQVSRRDAEVNDSLPSASYDGEGLGCLRKTDVNLKRDFNLMVRLSIGAVTCTTCATTLQLQVATTACSKNMSHFTPSESMDGVDAGLGD